MPEPKRKNTEIISTSRSSNSVVNRSESTDSFETVVPSLLGADIISDPENAEIDIWFVHGLTGNPKKTWTHEKTNVFWPKLLANDFPESRVITYGYDADIIKFAKDWGNASMESLESYGLGLAFVVRDELNKLQAKTPRPIYFMAHSLGGLVVEQALLESVRTDPSLQHVAGWTAGIMFFGVPHDGSHLAKWGSSLRKLIPQWIRSTNKDIIDVLKTDSKICKRLDGGFQKEAKHGKLKNVRLFSYYETRKLPGFSNLVVPESSAVLRGDPKGPIEGDHKSMTRYTGPNDPEYCKVKGQLTSWLLPEDAPLVEVPKRKKKSRVGISVQGASITGTFNGPVNAASNYATGNLFVTQGPNSTQQFFQRGRAGPDSSDEYGEPSSGSSSDSEDDDDDDSDDDDDENDDEDGEIKYIDRQ